MFVDSGGNRACRQISFYTAIVSWGLCGLLVTYGACLIILACVPGPPPTETGLDDAVPVSPQAQRIAHYSIDSNTLLMKSDEEAPPYYPRPLPFAPPLRLADPPRRQVQRSQRNWAGYSPNSYNPRTPGSGFTYSSMSPTSIIEADSQSPNYVDERRLLPPIVTNPVPRTPSSLYSTRTIQARNGFAGPGTTYLPAPPPVAAQFNQAQKLPLAQPHMTRSTSMSSSVYSSMSGEIRDGVTRSPPMPYMASRWVSPEQQSVRSVATSSGESHSSQSSQWKQLVLDAAAGRRQDSL